MKGKKITHLLIIGVAVVWGIIFYKIYAAITEETPAPTLSGLSKKSYFKEINHMDDSIELVMNYRNPFSLSHNPVEESENETKAATGKDMVVKVIPSQAAVNWPTVLYKGYISNPTSKQRFAILQINNAQALLAEGQSSNGLKLIRNWGDSVKVKYKNEAKYIKLN